MRHRLRLLSLLTALVAPQLPGQAPRPELQHTDGFFVFGGGSFTSLAADSLTRGRESAPTLSLGLGWGLSPRFALLFMSGGGFFRRGEDSRFESGEFAGGVRIHFVEAPARLVPYADVAVTSTIVRRDTSQTNKDPSAGFYERKKLVTGDGVSLGGGVLWALGPELALDASAHWTGAEMKTLRPGSTGKPDIRLGASVMRIAIGVAWYPTTGKRVEGSRAPGLEKGGGKSGVGLQGREGMGSGNSRERQSGSREPSTRSVFPICSHIP